MDFVGVPRGGDGFAEYSVNDKPLEFGALGVCVPLGIEGSSIFSTCIERTACLIYGIENYLLVLSQWSEYFCRQRAVLASGFGNR